MPISATQGHSVHVEQDPNLENIPKRYQGRFGDLTEEEKKLLFKYAKAKKVLLKISSNKTPNTSDKSTAIAKVAFDQRKHQLSKLAGEATQKSEASRGLSSSIKQVDNTEIEKRPKLKRPRAIMEAPKASKKITYEPAGYLLQSDWNSLRATDALKVALPNLSFLPTSKAGITGNSLVISATMPEDSRRFCFNICPNESYKENDFDTEIWYHFNPRDGWGRSQIVQNSFRKGSWDKAADRSIQEIPFEKGSPFELRIAICENGFAIYINGELRTEYFHRFGNGKLTAGMTLYLMVPVIEERYGDRENVVVHSVWWGYIAPDDNILRRYHKVQPQQNLIRKKPKRLASTYEYEERVLFIAGLPHDGTAKQELMRLFAHYGMAKDGKGEPLVKANDNQGYGFVTLESEQNVEDAIQYLDGQPARGEGTLKVERARKTSRS